MRFHYLQHVPFEDLASIKPLIQSHHHQLSVTHLYQNQALPTMADFDYLIVMGGPMGIDDVTQYPWLIAEKKFIQQAITTGKTILGICLGAQLMAQILGANISPNQYREIGWFPIQANPAIQQTKFSNIFNTTNPVFHWHGDTFDIPDNAIPVASSVACQHQGFFYDNRVLGLQFHLETTFTSAQALIQNCANELDGSTYVQSAQEILAQPQRFSVINQMMGQVFQQLFISNH